MKIQCHGKAGQKKSEHSPQQLPKPNDRLLRMCHYGHIEQLLLERLRGGKGEALGDAREFTNQMNDDLRPGAEIKHAAHACVCLEDMADLLILTCALERALILESKSRQKAVVPDINHCVIILSKWRRRDGIARRSFHVRTPRRQHSGAQQSQMNIVQSQSVVKVSRVGQMACL